jgi:N-acetylglucosamine kinase-like BadF-type ATPase
MRQTIVLLAESGSTKTEWVCFTQNRILGQFRTAGFNPNVQRFEQIETQLSQEVYHQLQVQPDRIIFYGAAFSNSDYCQRMELALMRTLRVSDTVVEHDMLAAARGTVPSTVPVALVGILGTGSNSCCFEHGVITRSLGGHGYLFGDEGGGVDLGKQLLKAGLDGRLTSRTCRRFEDLTQRSFLEWRRAVYEASKPNTLLGSLAPVVEALLDEPEVLELTTLSFEHYMEWTIKRYEHHQQLPLYLVGSIAYHFRSLIQEVCGNHGLSLAGIIQDPIHGLVAYHQKHEFAFDGTALTVPRTR